MMFNKRHTPSTSSEDEETPEPKRPRSLTDEYSAESIIQALAQCNTNEELGAEELDLASQLDDWDLGYDPCVGPEVMLRVNVDLIPACTRWGVEALSEAADTPRTSACGDMPGFHDGTTADLPDTDAPPSAADADDAAANADADADADADTDSGDESEASLATVPALPGLVLPESVALNAVGSSTHGHWSSAEDAAICDAVSRLGCRWRAVAALLPGRSDDAVRNRWARMQREGRAVATPDGVSKVKTNRQAEGRKPVRARQPGAAAPVRQCWTPDEDHLIISTVAEIGSRWGRIASMLPQRTEHGVRNRYNRLMLLAAEAASPPAPATDLPPLAIDALPFAP